MKGLESVHTYLERLDVQCFIIRKDLGFGIRVLAPWDLTHCPP